MHFRYSLVELANTFSSLRESSITVADIVENKDYIQNALEGIILTLRMIVDYFTHLFSALIYG